MLKNISAQNQHAWMASHGRDQIPQTWTVNDLHETNMMEDIFWHDHDDDLIFRRNQKHKKPQKTNYKILW